MNDERLTGWYESVDDAPVIFHWDGSDWSERRDRPDNWADLPAPGWYEPPDEPGRSRYWNGLEWTDQYQADVGGGSPDPEPVPMDPDAIWQVTGKPLSGLGAGRYKLTDRFLHFESGTLTTDAQQIPIAQVMDVDVKQGMSQKARNVASIHVHVQRSTGPETVVMKDVPNFREGQQLMNETAHEARLERQKREKTVRHERSSSDTWENNKRKADPVERLERLGELRDKGVITDEDFARKKDQILSEI